MVKYIHFARVSVLLGMGLRTAESALTAQLRRTSVLTRIRKLRFKMIISIYRVSEYLGHYLFN